MNFIRNRTLAKCDKVTEEMVDVIPSGFNNNIRWNIGHIAVSIDLLLYSFVGEKPPAPENYVKLFSIGTKPSEWEGELPSIEELKQYLSEQPSRIENTFSGRWE